MPTVTTEAASTLTALDVRGYEYTLTPGIIDDDAVRAFTRGQCAELAVALHDRTGWPLRVLVQGANSWLSLADDEAVYAAARRGDPLPSTYLYNLWGHVMVERPDGRLVDIYGARTPDTVLAEQIGNATGTSALWNGSGRDRIVALDRDTAEALPSCAPRSRGIGAHFVDAVLALPDVPAAPWPWLTTVVKHLEPAIRDAAQDDFDPAWCDELFDLDEEDLLEEAVTRGLIPESLQSAVAMVRANPDRT